MSTKVGSDSSAVPPPTDAVQQSAPSQGLDAAAQAKVGADALTANGSAVDNQAREFLSRAGLARTADGSQGVKDVGPTIAQGADGLNAAEQLYGTGETQLKPPAPPRVEMTQDLRVGAESFANNLDTVVNSLFFKNGARPTDSQPVPNKQNMTAEQTINYLLFDGKLGTADGRGEAPAALAESAAGLQATEGPADGRALITVDPKTGMPNVGNLTMAEVFSKENLQNVIKSANAQPALSGGVRNSAIKGVAPGDVRALSTMSADQLLAMFLKLNINDPNNSVETQNELHTLSTNLRQQGIDEAKKKAANAEVLRKEAEAYAQQAALIGDIVQVVMIVIMIVMIVVSFGAATPAAAGLWALVQAAATQMVQLSVMKVVMILIMLVLQIVNATAQSKSAEKTADASEASNAVERARKVAEEEQRRIEEEGAIIKLIMESKNQTVDAMMRMLKAMFSTNVKVMSAGMTR